MGIPRRACFQGDVGNGGAEHCDNDNPSQPAVQENSRRITDVHQSEPLAQWRGHELDHAQHKAGCCVSADSQQGRAVKGCGASTGGIQEHNRHHEKDYERNKPQDPMGEREREAAQQAPVPVGGAGFWDGSRLLASFHGCRGSGFRFFLIDGRLPHCRAPLDQLPRPLEHPAQQPFGKQGPRECDDDLPERIQHNRAAFGHLQVIPPPFTHCFHLQEHAPGQAQFIAYRTQPFPDQVEHLGDQAILGQSNWQYLLLTAATTGGGGEDTVPLGPAVGPAVACAIAASVFELSPLRFVLEDRQGVFCLRGRNRRPGDGRFPDGVLPPLGAKHLQGRGNC